jgi:hypothetical protein
MVHRIRDSAELEASCGTRTCLCERCADAGNSEFRDVSGASVEETDDHDGVGE